MWYHAAYFENEEKCRRTWRNLESELSRLNVNMFTVSLIYQSKWTVVSLSKDNPPAQAERIITKHLQAGTVIQVNAGALNALYERHLERRKHAEYKPSGPGLKYEGHNPVALPYEDFESPIAARLQRETTIKTFQGRGYPFLEIYAMFYKSQIDRDFNNEDMVHPYALRMGELSIVQLLNAERFMFTDSARAMHKAVYKGETEWIAPTREMWIEQDSPQEILPGLQRVKALYLKQMYPESLYSGESEPLRSTLLDGTYPFRDTWSIAVIDEHAYYHLTMLYDGLEKQYQISFDHACPYHACEILPFDEILQRYGMDKLLELNPPRYYREMQDKFEAPEVTSYPLVIPCEKCKQNADTIIAWLHTAMRQIKKDYALSTNPAPFPVKNLSYTEKKTMARGKKGSHGKPKEKLVSVYVPYTFITYDVSVTPASTPGKPLDQENKEQAPARVNWFSLHGKEDMIYEKRAQADIKRHYRLPYFKALVEKVKQGEKRSPEGEEYELLQEQDNYEVVGTVHFPNGRYVPMLKPEAKKQVVYKRVIASKYKATPENKEA